MPHSRGLAALAASVPPLVFLLVYGTAAGHGFISDDFGWIADSRVHSVHDALALFGMNHGFYRPVVALSFAANDALFGMHALAFGGTNLALAVLCAVLLHALLRALAMPRAIAWLGAMVWLLNFHGINMALLWISGRTSLLLIVGALVAAIGAVRGRSTLAIAGFALALFSKEEALGVPFIWVGALALGFAPPSRIRRVAAALAVGGIAVLGAYFWLRTSAGAMTPGTAPSYYRFTFAPLAVARNLLEYADRACTFAAACLLVGWLTLRPRGATPRSAVLTFGVIWVVAGYAITVWLPVRSSLYACFPSIGAAIVAAELLRAWWSASVPRRQRVALTALVVFPLLCAPIYVVRNHRWTDLADLSRACLEDIQRATAAAPAGTWLVLQDDRSQRANLQSAFGTLIRPAIELTTGRQIPLWIEPERPADFVHAAGLSRPCSTCRVVRLTLHGGRLGATTR